MTSANTQNGTGRYYWWLMGITATLLSGGVAATMHTIHSSSERIAVLESQAVRGRGHKVTNTGTALARRVEKQPEPVRPRSSQLSGSSPNRAKSAETLESITPGGYLSPAVMTLFSSSQALISYRLMTPKFHNRGVLWNFRVVRNFWVLRSCHRFAGGQSRNHSRRLSGAILHMEGLGQVRPRRFFDRAHRGRVKIAVWGGTHTQSWPTPCFGDHKMMSTWWLWLRRGVGQLDLHVADPPPGFGKDFRRSKWRGPHTQSALYSWWMDRRCARLVTRLLSFAPRAPCAAETRSASPTKPTAERSR
jgi:hypothetical protein